MLWDYKIQMLILEREEASIKEILLRTQNDDENTLSKSV